MARFISPGAPARKVWISAVACVMLLLLATAARAQQAPDYKAWGFETLRRIDADFGLGKGDLYAEKIKQGVSKSPAFMWGSGVQLSALVAAAELDKEEYLPELRRYIKGLDAYWQTAGPAAGYDVLPGPKVADRYYDDNLWLVLALTDASVVAGDTAYRDRAEAAFAFVLTGEDKTLGGGIYWREQKKTMKTTCANAPAIVAALRLFQVTGKETYRTAAERLYAWTNTHLQDGDGLYFDNIKLDGSVSKKKWSYNTALMIRANVLFYEVAKDEKYLKEAQRLAAAAEAKWVKPESGAIADGAMFAHLLAEAFLALHAADGNEHWRAIVERAVVFVHEKGRDGSGHFAATWDKTVGSPLAEVSLIHQASAVRAFLVLGALGREEGAVAAAGGK